MFPEAEIVAVVNGASETWMQPQVYDDNDVIVIRSKPGLLTALQFGYKYVAKNYPDLPVVRLDTAEHPLEHIPAMLQELRRAPDVKMIIGDLSFEIGRTLAAGTMDATAHLVVVPEIYRAASGGALPISGAHGFQAFATGADCALALAIADLIVDDVSERLGKTIGWGFDGAMALGALYAQLNPRILPVPAEQMRDRSTVKIMAQIEGAMQIVTSFERIRS